MDATPKPALSADVFKYWVIDRPNRQIRIILQSGQQASEPIGEDDPILKSEIAVSIFDWENWWVESLTKRGDFLVAEGYNPVAQDPLRGRPVVYLDQNHWSTVARAIVDPDLVGKRSEIEPALEVARLALDGGIVTPLSSAHLTETAPLFGDRRYQVGVAMAQLSGGWQMRDPIEVWRNEGLAMLASARGEEPPTKAKLPVMTLEPHAFLGDGVNAYALEPSDPKLFMLAVTSPSVVVDLLLDPERDPAVELPGWVERNQRISDSVAGSDESKEAKRRTAYAYLWAEHLHTIREAAASIGIDVAEFADADPRRISGMLSSKPMTRYWSGVFAQRYISTTTRWKKNDLTDVLFLACAAGYADYVVAEAATGTQLQQLQQSNGQARTVHRTLEELVRALKADGVRGVSDVE